MEDVVRFERKQGNIQITCIMYHMGKDISVSIFGGDLPHIGSLVLAEPRPSLTGMGISVTSSVINRIGHKDEAVARDVAHTLAKKYNVVVACTCGIHVEDATPEDIKTIMRMVEELKMEL